jgi:hypothetical protein
MTKKRRGFKQATLGTILTFGFLVATHRIRKSFGKVARNHPSDKTEEDTTKLGLHPDVVSALPRRGLRYDNGKLNEANNLILLGTAEAIYDTWAKAGWYAGDPITPLALTHAWITLVLNMQYKHGPLTPIMADGQIQMMSFQKPTKLNTFRQRHHSRIWATPYASSSGLPVWIAHTSYDKDIKSIFKIPPAHEIDADLDTEREFTVNDLVKAGAVLKGYVALTKPYESENAFGDKFFTDGKAAVLEMK